MFFKYEKEDLICADSRMCLLNKQTGFVKATVDNTKNIQGVYLHRDTKNEVWIRSGKVINTSMNKRLLEHKVGVNSCEETGYLPGLPFLEHDPFSHWHSQC